MIEIKNGIFHLHAGNCSYVLGISPGAEPRLVNHYWGGSVNWPDTDLSYAMHLHPSTIRESITENNGISPELMRLEFPVAGSGDLRQPALRLKYDSGSMCGRLIYSSYELTRDIWGPEGLPFICVSAEAEAARCCTLCIRLIDPLTGIEVELHYLPLPDLPIILRWVRIINRSPGEIVIDKITSASVDLPGMEADVISLDGAWGRERHFHRNSANQGLREVQSLGGISGHWHSPFIALTDSDSTEDYGRVWSTSLVYGGNHTHLVEVDPFGCLRMQSGINERGFSFPLESGAFFDSPASVLNFSSRGLTGLSDAHHSFVRNYLLPVKWRDRDRPIIVNTWEGHYFDVNHENVVALARAGKEVGAELLVLDDGWFVNRKDDYRALGDWTEDEEKFPRGLVECAREVLDCGMNFGLWVEPEMVNPDSNLYREHPEWIMNVEGRKPYLGRNQLVLNLARKDVSDYVLAVMRRLLSTLPVCYIKWDMNRSIVDVDVPETTHKYMLALYGIWSALTGEFPNVLFEGCASGGGRFDFGSLAYMPQYWTSDQTDPLGRLDIQMGTSLLFPPETMGAHISAVPNHQVGRCTPLNLRGIAALCFNFGFELDLTKFSSTDSSQKALLDNYKLFSSIYKENRSLFRKGRFLRLKGLKKESPYYAWSIVSQNADKVFVFYFQALAIANSTGRHMRLKGLTPSSQYKDLETNLIQDSNSLMDRGIWIPPSTGDYRSLLKILERID